MAKNLVFSFHSFRNLGLKNRYNVLYIDVAFSMLKYLKLVGLIETKTKKSLERSFMCKYHINVLNTKPKCCFKNTLLAKYCISEAKKKD